MEYIEAVLPLLFLSYFIFIKSFFYNLIPILINIALVQCIMKPKILKNALNIFLTQGIVVLVANCIYDMLKQISNHPKSLSISTVTTSHNFIFNLIFSLLFFLILFIINYIVYKKHLSEISFGNFLCSFLCGFFINVLILLFIMFRFNTVILQL